MTTTEAKYASEVKFTKDTPYLALTGEIWAVFCEDSGENWPRYKGTALKLAPGVTHIACIDKPRW